VRCRAGLFAAGNAMMAWAFVFPLALTVGAVSAATRNFIVVCSSRAVAAKLSVMPAHSN
jgi:hypothetical protein